MSGDELEKLGRSIVEKNRQARADYAEKSARLVAALMSETMEQLDRFNENLEGELRELLQGTGEDSTTSGADGSARPTDQGSGEPPQQ